MLSSTRIAALVALSFGLAACDSAQDAPAAGTETAGVLFDASVFPTTNNIIATQNLDDSLNKDRVFRVNPALTSAARLYDEPTLDAAIDEGVESLQQVAYARNTATFYSTIDGEDGNGYLVRANRRGEVEAVTMAGLSPKGVFVDIQVGTGFVGVADFGTSEANSQILIYNENYAEDEAPVVVISNLGTGGRAWDLFYTEADDILFVSKTNGEVAAYDSFVSKAQAFIGFGTPIVPDREFAISNPNDTPRIKRSGNLHGISYDDDTQILIVSDVRNPANVMSGRIYTVADGDEVGAPPNAPGTPSNLVDFRARIQSPMGGNNTRLGNPVDILGFGQNLYVAAKGSGKLLRFDNILTRTGLQGNISPNAMRDLKGAESVSFFQR